MTKEDDYRFGRIINKKQKRRRNFMSLNIVPSDVLTYTGDIFNALWVLLAIGLGIMVVPKLIGAAKTVFGGRRG